MQCAQEDINIRLKKKENLKYPLQVLSHSTEDIQRETKSISTFIPHKYLKIAL